MGRVAKFIMEVSPSVPLRLVSHSTSGEVVKERIAHYTG